MTDLFDIRVEFTYSDDPLGVACGEIRRLRVRAEELETEAIKDYVKINCSREEIDRLTADRDSWAETAKAYKDDYNEMIRTGKRADGHHITDDMID